MARVSEIVSRDLLHDLWGAGYTIVARPRDPFEIDPKLIPRGMAYQWCPIDLARDPGSERPGGWQPVPYARHEGVFAPWGTPGDVQIGQLELCERPAEMVVAVLGAAQAQAQQNVADWAKRAGAAGLTGEVKVGETHTLVGASGPDPYLRNDTKTIETTTAIPADMLGHLKAIFQERDRLEAEVVRKDRTLAPGPIADKFYAAVEANPGAPWWPTPLAVDNVRANLKKEPTDE
jgi:hypothetical protein